MITMRRIIPLSLIMAGFLCVACNLKKYEEVADNRIINFWAVTNDTHAFGEFDSLYYIINPIGNVSDSIYYNGNYTDSYYQADSTRVMLRYTTGDSITFMLDRLYAVQQNPMHLVMFVEAVGDTAVGQCRLHLVRDKDNGNIYRCGPDRDFTDLLAREMTLFITATNASSKAEPQGSQNYEFSIDTKGFHQAIEMADSLNALLHADKHKKYHGRLHHEAGKHHLTEGHDTHLDENHKTDNPNHKLQ